MKIKNYKCSFL